MSEHGADKDVPDWTVKAALAKAWAAGRSVGHSEMLSGQMNSTPNPFHGDAAALIERSSLGTPEAQALRASVSDEHAGRIVARANELSEIEALAEVITDADCASSEFPFSDESRAKAIYAAGYRRVFPSDKGGTS